MTSFTIGERDGELLRLLADHRILLGEHLQVALGLSAAALRRRLRALSAEGLIAERRVLHRQPPAYLITPRGLRTIGSSLPRPQLNLELYVHDVGAAWLWLAARDGAFGSVREILSERQLRSRDGLPRDPEAPGDGATHERLAVRQLALGPAGRERLHPPDLLLHTADGRRVALELEITPKTSARLEDILAAYGADHRIDAVVYVVNSERLEAKIRAAAARAAVAEKVFVRRFSWTPSMEALADQLGHASARERSVGQDRRRPERQASKGRQR